MYTRESKQRVQRMKIEEDMRGVFRSYASIFREKKDLRGYVDAKLPLTSATMLEIVKKIIYLKAQGGCAPKKHQNTALNLR